MDKDLDYDPLYDVSDDEREIRRAQLALELAKKRKEVKELGREIAKYDARDSRNQQRGKV